MFQVLEWFHSVIWGVPTLVLILGVGAYLSIRTGFVQLRLFPKAVVGFFSSFSRNKHTGISPMQALCTALAATVGTGNLAGVAGAIAIGGPGAVFWMWICGILGMIIKMAEATLAVRYRKMENGEYCGGPMYIIQGAMGQKWQWLATLYAFFGMVAAFGVGNATQINAVITGINQAITTFGGNSSRMGNLLLGVLLAIVIARMLVGGAKSIGKTAEKLVPIAAVAYLILGTWVLMLRADAIVPAFAAIFQGAFAPQAVTGGVVGSVISTLRIGVSRGVFTNEAGMGTAGIAHAGAQVAHPVQQGLLGIMEVFLDTIVICTMTALVILVSGVHIPFGTDTGVALTTQAFTSVCGDWASVFIAVALALFAFATVLGWGLYGARCAQFLFGSNAWRKFVLLQAVTVALAAVMNTGTVWLLSEIVNGLMAIPNLIALAALSPEFCRLIHEFKKKSGTLSADGGTNESFNQCQSLRAVTDAKIPSFGSTGRKGRQKDLPSEYRSA